MKIFMRLAGVLFLAVYLSACASGTYVTIYPAAKAEFDYEHFAKLGFAFIPRNEQEKVLKKSLSEVLKAELFKIVPEKDEADAFQQTGIVPGKEISRDEARRLGRAMKANAVIVLNSFKFTNDGRAEYISLYVIDSYDGQLLDAVYKGGEKPEAIDRAARSIVNHIVMEDIELKTRREGDNRDLIP